MKKYKKYGLQKLIIHGGFLVRVLIYGDFFMLGRYRTKGNLLLPFFLKIDILLVRKIMVA